MKFERYLKWCSRNWLLYFPKDTSPLIRHCINCSTTVKISFDTILPHCRYVGVRLSHLFQFFPQVHSFNSAFFYLSRKNFPFLCHLHSHSLEQSYYIIHRTSNLVCWWTQHIRLLSSDFFFKLSILAMLCVYNWRYAYDSFRKPMKD